MPRRKSIDARIEEAQEAVKRWERTAALAATKLRKYRRRVAGLYRQQVAELKQQTTNTVAREPGRKLDLS